jgi:hypothetical protein
MIRANAHQGSVPDLGERWPARLVAMAAEDRLSITRNLKRRFRHQWR